MEPLTMEDYWRMWDKKMEEIDNNDPWLVYVAEKSKTSCMKCQENHTKRFRSSDASKPEIPVHPNCKCKYVPLSEATEEMTTMRSIKMFVRQTNPLKKTPANTTRDFIDKIELNPQNIMHNMKSLFFPDDYGLIQAGFSINSTDNMLDILERECKQGTLGELIIVGHGTGGGRFELGDRMYRFDQMTENQINRLYNLLSPNAVIDLRFCYGAQGEFGETVVQNLANKLRCKIRAYANQVSPIRTRPLYVIDDKVPWMEKIFYYDRKEKTFYPK